MTASGARRAMADRPFRGRVGADRLVTRRLQGGAQKTVDLALVVDDEDAGPMRAHAGTGADALRKLISTRVPRPS